LVRGLPLVNAEAYPDLDGGPASGAAWRLMFWLGRRSGSLSSSRGGRHPCSARPLWSTGRGPDFRTLSLSLRVVFVVIAGRLVWPRYCVLSHRSRQFLYGDRVSNKITGTRPSAPQGRCAHCGSGEKGPKLPGSLPQAGTSVVSLQRHLSGRITRGSRFDPLPANMAFKNAKDGARCGGPVSIAARLPPFEIRTCSTPILPHHGGHRGPQNDVPDSG